MIEEEHIRFVAAADVTDDCRVEVLLRKRRKATLTASQARQLAAELVRSAGEAERAADELRHEHEPASFDVAIFSPDCRDGKHLACHGDTWDVVRDQEATCACTCHPLREGTGL